MSCSQTKPTIDNKTNKTSEIIKYNRLNQTIPTNYINTTGMEDLDKIRIKILALTADTIKLSDEYRKKSGQDDQTFYQLQMKLIGMSPAEIMQSWNMSSEQEKATIEAMYHRVYDNVQKFDQLKSNFDQQTNLYYKVKLSQQLQREKKAFFKEPMINAQTKRTEQQIAYIQSVTEETHLMTEHFMTLFGYKTNQQKQMPKEVITEPITSQIITNVTKPVKIPKESGKKMAEILQLAAYKKNPWKKHNDWINNQPDDSFMIQIAASYDEVKLLELAQQYNINNKSIYFRMQLNGKPWYCLQYGYYPDRDVAIEALNNLKGEVLEFQPWLRGMKSAKDAIQTADKILN
ncbi:MAG: hypothetical protein HON94_11995 [Methylococcales bacterium]|nr:hypothetical protein [Methylococcales bacterium]MBT7408872.1 hypothetical protein [Methylococcales bacterium]